MTEKTKKLYIKTHGCQMNEYDSARIQDLLGVSHGLEPTDNPEEADCLVAQYLLYPGKSPGEGLPPARPLETAQGK